MIGRIVLQTDGEGVRRRYVIVTMIMDDDDMEVSFYSCTDFFLSFLEGFYGHVLRTIRWSRLWGIFWTVFSALE